MVENKKRKIYLTYAEEEIFCIILDCCKETAAGERVRGLFKSVTSAIKKKGKNVSNIAVSRVIKILVENCVLKIVMKKSLPGDKKEIPTYELVPGAIDVINITTVRKRTSRMLAEMNMLHKRKSRKKALSEDKTEKVRAVFDIKHAEEVLKAKKSQREELIAKADALEDEINIIQQHINNHAAAVEFLSKL